MSRSRSRHHRELRDPLRDTLAIANEQFHLQNIQNDILSLQRKQQIRQLEDRRQFHPLRQVAPALALSRKAARQVLRREVRKHYHVPERWAFQTPSKVAICVRRKIRREVINALYPFKKRGFGSGAKRRNYYSEVKC